MSFMKTSVVQQFSLSAFDRDSGESWLTPADYTLVKGLCADRACLPHKHKAHAHGQHVQVPACNLARGRSAGQKQVLWLHKLSPFPQPPMDTLSWGRSWVRGWYPAGGLPPCQSPPFPSLLTRTASKFALSRHQGAYFNTSSHSGTLLQTDHPRRPIAGQEPIADRKRQQANKGKVLRQDASSWFGFSRNMRDSAEDRAAQTGAERVEGRMAAEAPGHSSDNEVLRPWHLHRYVFCIQCLYQKLLHLRTDA
jgi:hypothetical protein